MQPGSNRRSACGNRSRKTLTAAAAALVTVLSAAFVPDAVAASWPQDDYNPKPDKADVILPMPCDGAMAFRKVAVPLEGVLSDRAVTVGSNDDAHGYEEGARPAWIAGSFGTEESRYFLIGKYEVTQLQYQALTSSTCPQLSADLRLPQVETSWFDAVSFADRYSLWLRRNAADKLPKDDGELGFLRLPTEVEWEYAARGGTVVSASDFSEAVFPMKDGPLARYVWFGGSASSNNKLQRIGLLLPNPLGIHDILGNADEMVLDPFRLNRLDRLHGQAGGFIVRGGNFTTPEADMRAAYRHEVPFYRDSGPRTAKTTGFRLVVASPVITSRKRLQAIESEWAELGSAPAPTPAAPGPAAPALGPVGLDDPIKELGVIADASSDTNMRKRLKDVQLALRASFAARDEQRDRAAKARLRLGTFLCQKLKDDGLPISRIKEAYKACAEARGADHERCVDLKQRIDSEGAKQYENLRYYADTIVTLTSDYDMAVIDQQAQTLRGELTAAGLPQLVAVSNIYTRHVADYVKNKTIDRAKWLTSCETGS